MRACVRVCHVWVTGPCHIQVTGPVYWPHLHFLLTLSWRCVQHTGSILSLSASFSICTELANTLQSHRYHPVPRGHHRARSQGPCNIYTHAQRPDWKWHDSSSGPAACTCSYVLIGSVGKHRFDFPLSLFAPLAHSVSLSSRLPLSSSPLAGAAVWRSLH